MRNRANEAAARLGRPQAGKVIYRRWRRQQEHALAFVEADVAMTSLGLQVRRFQQASAGKARAGACGRVEGGCGLGGTRIVVHTMRLTSAD